MAFSTALWALLAVFLASTFKTLPLAYLVRFYSSVFSNLILKSNKYFKTGENTFGITGKNPLDVFRVVSYHTYCSPLELDMFLHKSNSTYFIDLDIARTKLVSQVFQKLFIDSYHNVTGEFKGKGMKNVPYTPVGELSCAFRKEIKLFQKFAIHSNILAWDDKWLYVLSKVALSNGKLCTLVITKYVFKKNGRLSMKPREYMAYCGLYNDAVEKINAENYKLVQHMNGNAEALEKLAEEMEVTSENRHL